MARVLVVEDDHILQEFVVHVLEHEGHECKTATNGQEGVESVRQEKPDVVLMDLVMPVMSGLDAIREIRRDPATKDCRILAMSAGKDLLQVNSECMVDGVIRKPFDIDILIADVSSHARQATAA